jgi:hypothetical protein
MRRSGGTLQDVHGQGLAWSRWKSYSLSHLSLTQRLARGYDREMYLETTGVIGGKMGPPPEPTQLDDTSKVREGNNLVVKLCWPENRTGEVKIPSLITDIREL